MSIYSIDRETEGDWFCIQIGPKQNHGHGLILKTLIYFFTKKAQNPKSSFVYRHCVVQGRSKMEFHLEEGLCALVFFCLPKWSISQAAEQVLKKAPFPPLSISNFLDQTDNSRNCAKLVKNRLILKLWLLFK